MSKTLLIEPVEGGADAASFAVELGDAVGRWLSTSPIQKGTTVSVPINQQSL